MSISVIYPIRSLLEKIQVIVDIFEQKPSQEVINTFRREKPAS